MPNTVELDINLNQMRGFRTTCLQTAIPVSRNSKTEDCPADQHTSLYRLLCTVIRNTVYWTITILSDMSHADYPTAIVLSREREKMT